MRVVIFCQSLLSDWNHGNAHFLRGVVSELVARGCRVTVYEPRDSWCVTSLVAAHGEAILGAARRTYPALDVVRFAELDVAAAVDGADLVLVHEWNQPELVRAVGEARRAASFTLLFHDTHHRSVTAPNEMARYELTHYDGVLAFGEAVRAEYLRHGWAARVFTWHEAADVRVFRPLRAPRRRGVVWIGNWGDEERTAELRDLLVEPVRRLRLPAAAYGVRYPEAARAELEASGISYNGWVPNWRVPRLFARAAVTLHIPRRPYARQLPGIPTIRVFEALACGIPLISGRWYDVEGLFRPGDFLVADTGSDVEGHLRNLLEDPELARAQAERGLSLIHTRHTCAHRVDELLRIVRELQPGSCQPEERAS